MSATKQAEYKSGSDVLELVRSKYEAVRSRRPEYSLRSYAKFLGITATQLTETLSRKRRLTPRIAARILMRLGHGADSIQSAMKALPKNKKEFRELSQEGRFSFISENEFRLISDWWTLAILVLAETKRFRPEPHWVSKQLGIPIRDAKRSVSLLKQHQFLVKGANGHWQPSEKQISTSLDVPSELIRAHHIRGLEQAKELIDLSSVEERELIAQYIAADPKRIHEAKKRVRAFTQELAEFLEGGEKSKVYKLSVQLLPLVAKASKSKTKEGNYV